MKTVVQEISSAFDAYNNCVKSENTEWEYNHEQKIKSLIKEYLPRGSGIDCDVKLDFDMSSKDRLIFYSSFHCMDEYGGYDGWIDFRVIVKPSFSGIDLDVKGRFSERHGKYSFIQEGIADEFYWGLNSEVKEKE